MFEIPERVREPLEPLRPLYDAWMATIAAFSWLLARVLLTLAFFTVFLTYGIVLRLLRRDPMNRSLDATASSYWQENVVSNKTIEEFQRQY